MSKLHVLGGAGLAITLLAGAFVVRGSGPEPRPRAEPVVADTPLAVAPRFTPDVEPVAKPEHVRGIYLNAWAAGSPTKRRQLIELAQRTEINAFVIDVKEGGWISYPSNVPLSKQLGTSEKYIPDVRRVLRELRDAGIYPIARIVVFKDPVLAEKKPEWAIRHVDGGVWKDNKGNLWVDSFNRDVWDYNIAIAREAVKLGFAEVQWDYVRFPDVPASYKRTSVWPARNGRALDDGIRQFLLYARDELADLEVPLTADVFGLTVTFTDMGIGQKWEKMVDAVDVLLPMVYPSHYQAGNYGLKSPNASPYETVKRAMDDAVRRSAPFAQRATIRPWLQDFTLGPPRYGPDQVRAQIRAVYDAGLTEWVLWNPGSRYTVGALLAEGETDAATAPPKVLGQPVDSGFDREAPLPLVDSATAVRDSVSG